MVEPGWTVWSIVFTRSANERLSLSLTFNIGPVQKRDLAIVKMPTLATTVPVWATLTLVAGGAGAGVEAPGTGELSVH